MKKGLYLVLFLFLISCQENKEGESVSLDGEWKAEWETLPESYPGIENVEFTMNGLFTFQDNSITIKANGYPGCIFNIDTIEHTQKWKINGDTLFLFSDPEVMSLTYQIKQMTKDSISLQLMEDIFITLTK